MINKIVNSGCYRSILLALTLSLSGCYEDLKTDFNDTLTNNDSDSSFKKCDEPEQKNHLAYANSSLKTQHLHAEEKIISMNNQRETIYPDLAANESATLEQLVQQVLTLPNNRSRRDSLEKLQLFDESSIEEVIYQLSNSDRLIDQESAIELLITSKTLLSDSAILPHLLSLELHEAAQTRLIYSASDALTHSITAEFYELLINHYHRAKYQAVKSAVISSLMRTVGSVENAFIDVFSLLENDLDKKPYERLQDIENWVKDYAGHFNQEQQVFISNYSETLYMQADSFEQKRYAIKIGGVINDLQAQTTH